MIRFKIVTCSTSKRGIRSKIPFRSYSRPEILDLSWQDLTKLLLKLGDHGTHGKNPFRILLR